MRQPHVMLALFVLVGAALLAQSGCGGGGNGGDNGEPQPQLGTVAGAVVDGLTQEPIAGATVSVQGTALQDTADEQGDYEIGDVPAGSRTVQASAPGYTPSTQTVNVQANATVTCNFTLMEAGLETGTIAGTVTNADTGQPLANVLVEVVGAGLQDTTDAQGAYEIEWVVAATVTVRASAAGFTTVSHSVTVTAGATVTRDFALAPLSAAGNTFYVSPTGNDGNAGTLQQPWRTPGHGSKQLAAGDTLVIMAGTYVMREYYDDMITPEVSGRADAWITIMGESEVNRPVLEGAGSLLAAIEIGGRSYIRIRDLEIRSHIDAPYTGGLREGIEAGGSDDPTVQTGHIEIVNVEMHRLEEVGINFSGNIKDATVESCRIHHTAYTCISAPSAAGGRGWERVVIRNSSLFSAGHFYEGIQQPSPYDRPDGLGMEPGDGPLEVAYCMFEHNAGDGLDSKTRNTYVHDCVIRNNYADGLKLWGGGSRVENVLINGCGDGDPHNGPWASIVVEGEAGDTFDFVNVTVDDQETRTNYPVYMQYGLPGAITVNLRNCIFAHGENVFYFGDTVTLNADHCLFYRGANPALPVVYANGRDYLPSEIGLLGAGNISADPLFVTRAWGTPGDYRLQAASPAIDAGTATGAPSTALVGLRPQGGGYDMGAYEQ